MAEKKLLKRETYCGAIRDEHVGQTITVYGWVNNMRELGGLTFIDLRDREGLVQLSFGLPPSCGRMLDSTVDCGMLSHFVRIVP